MVRNYDYPAKSWVRSWFFTAIDRLFPKGKSGGRHAVYLPSRQDLEGPLYAQRGITTYPVERDESVIASMGDVRHRIFYGTLDDWLRSPTLPEGERLSIANLDFEGQLNTHAHELVSLFRVFLSSQGGLLRLTTFANMDPESVLSGMVHANAFDSLLGGTVRTEFQALYNQLTPYLESLAKDTALAHAQFCRDFGVLWRLLVGMALWDSPMQGIGDFRPEVYSQLAHTLGAMHREVDRIRQIGVHNTFSFVQEPAIDTILNPVSTPLFPLSLERAIYRSRGNNRMSTWIVSLGRLHAPVPIQHVAQQLWQLYSRSPLTSVAVSGRVQTYLPR